MALTMTPEPLPRTKSSNRIFENERVRNTLVTLYFGGLDRLKQVRSTIPAVTHVDFSARVQTVRADTQPRFHALLSRFHQITGCPTLVNTSFNVRGEPVVGSPEDAFRCFMGTHLDRLAVGNCYLVKADQPAALAREYAHLLPAD